MKQTQIKKRQSVTVGICTSFAGKNLLTTAQAIAASVQGVDAKLVIYADNTPISSVLRASLIRCGFSVHWSSGPGSFLKKARKLIAETTTELLILTQDDILFDAQTVRAVLRDFEIHPRCTMLGVKVLPLTPTTFFEHATASMIRIVDGISSYWRAGDNYLAASGRCLAFRTAMIKTIHIPEVVNGDVYLYLANRKAGGVFVRSSTAIVQIRAPQTFDDQIGPSSRFQYSHSEMQQYFKTNLNDIYRVPAAAILRAFANEFFRHPVSAVYYVWVFGTTRIRRKRASDIMKTVWSADMSTKHIAA